MAHIDAVRIQELDRRYLAADAAFNTWRLAGNKYDAKRLRARYCRLRRRYDQLVSAKSSHA